MEEQKLTKEQARELADHIMGTTISIDQALEEMGLDLTENDLTESDYWEIENVTFNCVVCGWWCEVGDYAGENDEAEHGGMVCSNCGSNEEDE